MPLGFRLCTHQFDSLQTFCLLPVACGGRTLSAPLGSCLCPIGATTPGSGPAGWNSSPPSQQTELRANIAYGTAGAGTLQLLLKSNLITVAEEFFSMFSGSFTVLPHSPLCLLSLSQYLPFNTFSSSASFPPAMLCGRGISQSLLEAASVPALEMEAKRTLQVLMAPSLTFQNQGNISHNFALLKLFILYFDTLLGQSQWNKNHVCINIRVRRWQPQKKEEQSPIFIDNRERK